MHHLAQTILHWLGIDSTTDHAYAWWSGVGSDIGELAIAGWLYAFLRRHNCEVHRCWRLGRHATAAGHVVCRRHHPDGHLTARAVITAHRIASGE